MLVAFELKLSLREVGTWSPDEVAWWLAFIKLKAKREEQQLNKNKGRGRRRRR